MRTRERTGREEPPDDGNVFIKILLPLISIDIPEKRDGPSLEVVVDWNDVEWQEAVANVTKEIQEKINNGLPLLNDRGEKHYIQHPYTNEMMRALTEETVRGLKNTCENVIGIIPRKIRKMLEE